MILLAVRLRVFKATLVGFVVRAVLSRCLSDRIKTVVHISIGTHNTEEAVSK